MTAWELVREVERHFQSLMDEHGFKVIDAIDTAPEATVNLENATTGVSVHLEIGGVPWIKISRLERVGGRLVPAEGYDLLFLLDYRAPEQASEIRGLTSRDAELVLALLVQNLSRYGLDLLSGDFRVFGDLKRMVGQT